MPHRITEPSQEIGKLCRQDQTLAKVGERLYTQVYKKHKKVRRMKKYHA